MDGHVIQAQIDGGMLDYASHDDHIRHHEQQLKHMENHRNEPDHEDDDSSYEEGELNSDQKQKLKNDLLRMGYDEDEEEFGATVGVLLVLCMRQRQEGEVLHA